MFKIMTITLRFILILSSLVMILYFINKIRKIQIYIYDSIFWICLTGAFIIFSIFPKVPDFLAAFFGVYSTANFLFLFTIGVLIIKLFLLSLKFSKMNQMILELAQYIAILEHKIYDKTEEL